MDLAVNNLPLFFSAMLMAVALIISTREKLGLTKDTIISVIRVVIQLVAVDYLLEYVFQVNNLILTPIMVLVIIPNTTFNAKKRSQQLQKDFLISFTATGCNTGITVGILIFSGSTKFVPSQIIPINEMITNNPMMAIGLCYRNLNTLFQNQWQAVMGKLTPGVTIKLASLLITQQSVKTGMASTTDSVKIVGIVSLPGMMSGLIFAGVNPAHAIKHQIMVTFMLLSTTSIGSVIATYLVYKGHYN